MKLFFVYAHAGGMFSMDAMECAPNAEIVKRQLASRVRTGTGKSWFVGEPTQEAVWPEAQDDACMVVWRARSGETPTGNPDEVWLFSGNTDRPTIVPATAPRATPSAMRVPEDVFRRRVGMGWDPERARTTPLGSRAGSVRGPYTRSLSHVEDSAAAAGRRTLGRAPEIHTAFGLTRSVAEWHDLTGISEAALRHGAKRNGSLEQYLRNKQWHQRGPGEG